MKKFRDFESAREFARSLNLKRQKEWLEYCKSGNKPDDIPSAPWHTYKKDYKGMGDWLGTGRIADKDRVYRSFKEAREFVRSLNLKGQKEWIEYCKSGDKPDDIPAALWSTYKKEWISMRDILGTGNIANYNKVFRPYQEAREFARALKLKGEREWREYCKSGNKPDDIPSHSYSYYKKEWKGWGDFLGNEWRSFESAREFVRKLGLKFRKEWVEYCKSGNKPDDIPIRPEKVYKKEWKGWRNFLGNEWRSIESAREFVLSLGLKSNTKWREYCKSGDKPDDIPAQPDVIYKNEWKGWGDFLGTGNVLKKEFKDFESAREFVLSLGLKSNTKWKEYCKSGNKPDDIPAQPDVVYKKDFKGYGDWLGTGNIANFNKVYRPFKEAREFVLSLGLKSSTKWKEYCKSGDKPDDIPVNPDVVYKKDFKGFGDWLGTGNIANFNKVYRPFKEAREFVQKLGLKNHEEWKEYCKSGNKPNDIPAVPWVVYKEWKKK
jgi:hypothetical protein